MQLKNIRPIIMQEAVDFLKAQSQVIAKVLTTAHHKLLTSVIEARSRNEQYIAEREHCRNNWSIIERAYAMKSPIMEAEYALDERTPLSLYNCMIPMLKEHRRLYIGEKFKFSMEDFAA